MLHVLYLIAISAEAMSATLAAGRRQLDWLGVCVVACVTALGGGSLRDILLGRHPLSWIAHPEYLLFVIGAALAAGLFARWMHRLRAAFLTLDALGLVVFTLLGCNIAQSEGVHFGIVLVMGMITGSFGGVLRDILCAQIPLMFQKELYASVSLATGLLYLTLPEWGVSHEAVVLMAPSFGFVLRLLAIRYDWQLPRFVYSGDR